MIFLLGFIIGLLPGAFLGALGYILLIIRKEHGEWVERDLQEKEWLIDNLYE